MFPFQSCLWPRRDAIPLLLGAWLLVSPAQVLPRETASLPAWSRNYDPARDPAADGRAAIDLARRTNRLVLIVIGGNWCVWCQRLDLFLDTHPDLRTRLHRQFVVLKVNVSEANENADFLAGLPRFVGYPHAFIADARGRILHSQDPRAWLKDGQYSPARFRAFLNRWQADAQTPTRD